MRETSLGLIIGISIGVVIGISSAMIGFFCTIRYRRKLSAIAKVNSRSSSTTPIRAGDGAAADSCGSSSVCTESPKSSTQSRASWSWIVSPKKAKANPISASGIPEYSYKEVQRATNNFTTLIGKGAYGPVYKARTPSGETAAVKVLANDSKQGEKEFQTEVMLLGRLHHRNLVNLVGYCSEKSQRMLIYVYMGGGSLASRLYDENLEPLKWDLRVQIALDVARGLEYLHDGAVPPVIHRDIKSSNILLDQSMRARVADFGLSMEEVLNKQVSNNIRGTFGYLDPEYVSTRSFTKKSDVYSFGVLLFELIAGLSPLQGLMEHVELAAMSTDGKAGWEEIADPRLLDGGFNVRELNEVANLAHRCMSHIPKKRPSMRGIVQALSMHGSSSSSSSSSTRYRTTVITETENEVVIDVGSVDV